VCVYTYIIIPTLRLGFTQILRLQVDSGTPEGPRRGALRTARRRREVLRSCRISPARGSLLG